MSETCQWIDFEFYVNVTIKSKDTIKSLIKIVNQTTQTHIEENKAIGTTVYCGGELEESMLTYEDNNHVIIPFESEYSFVVNDYQPGWPSSWDYPGDPPYYEDAVYDEDDAIEICIESFIDDLKEMIIKYNNKNENEDYIEYNSCKVIKVTIYDPATDRSEEYTKFKKY